MCTLYLYLGVSEELGHERGVVETYGSLDKDVQRAGVVHRYAHIMCLSASSGDAWDKCALRLFIATYLTFSCTY